MAKISTLFADKVSNSPSIGGSARRAREALSSPTIGGSARKGEGGFFLSLIMEGVPARAREANRYTIP